MAPRQARYWTPPRRAGSSSAASAPGRRAIMLADSQGKWRGLSVDVCRAVAAAIFGDADKVKYQPLTSQQRFTAIQSGEVDMLVGNATWTLTRDTALGLDFTGVYLLRRPELPGAEEARREERQGTERRHHLRGARHHHRAQPGRLFPRQQDDLQAGRHREGRRDPLGLLRRALRRLYDGRLEPGRDPGGERAAAAGPSTISSSCRRSSPRSRWGRWCATATTSSPTSCAGRSMP